MKLRSKWITQTEAKQTPLPVYTLNHELMDLGVVDAHALATDKVIKVSPAREAPSKAAGKDVYRDEEWTYAEAMAQYTDPLNRPILIDMESYGIASVAVPIGEDLGIIVLRVATDALNDKRNQGKPDQQRLLTEPLPALAQIIARIAEPGSPPV
ncbi:hypothetical protein OKHIL_76380 [Mycolicibacterium mageritense]|nr:hypothetical protein MTY414_74330 [Mycolicibacterium mageritense]